MILLPNGICGYHWPSSGITNYHTSLGCSPFKALYGYNPSYGFFYSLLQSDHVDVEQWLCEHQTHLTHLKAHLLKAPTKSNYMLNRTAHSFTMGDAIYLKLQPYCQHLVVNPPCAKLGYKYYGPFEILDTIWTCSLQTPSAY